MFRLGGSTSGITSGLDTPKRGRVDGPGGYGGIDYDKAFETSQRLTDKFYPKKGANLNRFLINWGLNMVGNPPSGNVLQTAAKQAQQPTSELFESMDRDDYMRSATGADIFGKVIAAEGEMRGGEAGARWQKEWEVNTIKNAYNGIVDNNIKLDELRKDPEGNKAQILELEKENREHKVDIAHLQKQDPLVKSISSNKEIIGNIYNSTIEKLEEIQEDVLVTEENKHLYPDSKVGDMVYKKKWDKDSPEIQAEAIRQIKIMFPPGGEIDLTFLEKKAEGGRIGYQGGELVEDVNVQETIQPGGMAGQQPVQPGEAPEVESIGMTFEELRARLPAIITDDIVILLSQSAQALEDFATIQTQQDVDNFNTKYNVNLILPAEG
jgi:hypothetical protein